MTRCAFVTGANGAIGHHVVHSLAARGWCVVGLGHGPKERRLPLDGYINGEIDGMNLSTLASSFGEPDAVIHLAGGSSVGASLLAPAEDFARTVATSVRLLDWVRIDAPEAAVVLASSAAVYGDAQVGAIPETAPRAPVSPYGFHKAMMEQVGECWARTYGLRVAIMRLFSVYGPHLHKQLVWELCLKLAVGEAVGEKTITLGGTGDETRDWLHIEDAAAMLIGAIEHASPAVPIFNGCTGRATTVKHSARLIAAGFGSDVAITFSGDRRPGDPIHLVGAPRRAASAGLVAHIDVDDGIPDTARAARTLLS